MWKVYALLSAFFAALVAIFAKIGIQGIDSNLATAIRTVVILLMTWGIVLATVPLEKLGEISLKSWSFLILSGLATGASWLFYFKALQLGPVSQVAPIDKLSVVIVMLLAFFILRERPDIHVVAGGVLIVCGTLLMLK